MSRTPASPFLIQLLGQHPFPVQLNVGDDRWPAYQPDASSEPRGPGIQVPTRAAESQLSAGHGVAYAELVEAAAALGQDVPFLLNTAAQSRPEAFLPKLAATRADAGDQVARHRRALEALKQSVDVAGVLGPQAIVRSAFAHLAGPSVPGGAPYGNLLAYANRSLAGAGNPRRRVLADSLSDTGDIGSAGVELWWVKEGSATIVFQVVVHRRTGESAARFVLNVAKDLTAASSELRQTYADFVDLYAMDPVHVMEPFGLGVGRVATWRGEVAPAVLVAEWFDGHELHAFAGSPHLHIWHEQRMAPDHPLDLSVSDQVWEDTIRVRARYTRRTAAGLLPIDVQIDAGDFIFRAAGPGRWDMLLIWFRRPPPGVPMGEYLVVTSLMAGTTPYERAREATVWWDQPERALRGLVAGLTDAGFGAAEIRALLAGTLAGPLTTYQTSPERIPYLPVESAGDPGRLRAVFARARSALEAFLATT